MALLPDPRYNFWMLPSFHLRFYWTRSGHAVPLSPYRLGIYRWRCCRTHATTSNYALRFSGLWFSFLANDDCS